jgi:hypothetical protein
MIKPRIYSRTVFLSLTILVFLFTSTRNSEAGRDLDIRKLNQHFIGGDNLDPWLFIPDENIREISATENPGYLTIRQEGRGQDIRGILKEPIRLSDYPLPWKFHMGIVQNYLGVKGLVDEQINWAIGLNLVVTYSDPSTWPADRTQRPPDTEELQIFVVHMGNQGENYRQGLPAVKHTDLNQRDYSPEVYMIYGRGDLAPTIVNGRWDLNYSWVGFEKSLSGTWKRFGGPAEYSIRFTVGLSGNQSIEVGVGAGHDSGWQFKQFGTPRPITGIWEIGPIISGDRWIPDVLASELEINKAPMWIDSFREHYKFLKKITPEQIEILDQLKQNFQVQPPDKRFEYYVDYMHFYGSGPENVEHLSDDFNIPGFLADMKYYIEGDVFGETYSNPGYMTLTSYGMNGGWALCPIGPTKMDVIENHEPPFEIELCFIPPGNERFWNLWWNVGLYDTKGTNHPWQPCITHIPGKDIAFSNSGPFDPKRGSYVNPGIKITPEFGPELTQEIMTARPLYMLIQIPNQYHLRVGFKAAKDDPWVFSKPFDSKEVFGEIAAFAYPALVSFQGDHVGGHGWGAGNWPYYQRFMIDYLYYRYGSSR